MICNSRRTIFYIYNTTFCKTVLFHQLLHNPIIGMGIHSDIPGNIFTVIRNTLKQSMHLSIPGKPVDCKIRFIISSSQTFGFTITQTLSVRSFKVAARTASVMLYISLRISLYRSFSRADNTHIMRDFHLPSHPLCPSGPFSSAR